MSEVLTAIWIVNSLLITIVLVKIIKGVDVSINRVENDEE